VIKVRMTDAVDSKHGHIGQIFGGTVHGSVLDGNRVVLPRGTEAHVELINARKGGHIKGKAEVEVELVSLIVNGTKYPVSSDLYEKRKGVLSTKGKASATAAAEEAPSAVGDVIGTSTAGPVGMGAELAARPAIAILRGPKVVLPPNYVIDFELTRPATLPKPEVAGPQASVTSQ
jgi:hypothetical protein